jgi:hypothetical protein
MTDIHVGFILPMTDMCPEFISSLTNIHFILWKFFKAASIIMLDSFSVLLPERFQL